MGEEHLSPMSPVTNDESGTSQSPSNTSKAGAKKKRGRQWKKFESQAQVNGESNTAKGITPKSSPNIASSTPGAKSSQSSVVPNEETQTPKKLIFGKDHTPHVDPKADIAGIKNGNPNLREEEKHKNGAIGAARNTTTQSNTVHSHERTPAPSMQGLHQHHPAGASDSNRQSQLPLKHSDRKTTALDNRNSRGDIQSHANNRGVQKNHAIQSDSFARPPPLRRKIYDPNRDSGLPPKNLDNPAPVRAQCKYIGQIADIETHNAEILVDDELEKEDLRQQLEVVCREAITNHERMHNPDFDSKTVVLECFGSLKSGFATRGSDMDLLLVSPHSRINPSSPDSEIPRLLERIFLVMGFGARLLQRTRVPIIRCCQSPSPELLEALINETLKAGVPDTSTSQEKVTATANEPRKDFDGHDLATEVADRLHIGGVPSEQTKQTPDKERPQGPNLAVEQHSDAELVRMFTLAIQEGWFNEYERRIINEFKNLVKEANGDLNHPDLSAYRPRLRMLPNVLARFREIPDPSIEFPKSGTGIQWDVNFSIHLLARHNTQLQRCYSTCDPRIRLMVIFVKAWAKKRDINSPYRGTLSSYGFVLMVLHYVVNIANPPLAPNLQLQRGLARGGAPGNEKVCDGYDVCFWRDEEAIELARTRGQITYSKETLGSLLRGFFSYYAEMGGSPEIPKGGFAWTRDALSLRSEGGLLAKASKGWIGAKTDIVESKIRGEKPLEIRQRYLLSIEDPFEIEHNVARTVTHDGLCAIRDEFGRAYRIIQNLGVIGGCSGNMFQEKKHTELDRPRTYFGPKPGSCAPRQPRYQATPHTNQAQSPSTSSQAQLIDSGEQTDRNAAPGVVKVEQDEHKIISFPLGRRGRAAWRARGRRTSIRSPEEIAANAAFAAELARQLALPHEPNQNEGVKNNPHSPMVASSSNVPQNVVAEAIALPKAVGSPATSIQPSKSYTINSMSASLPLEQFKPTVDLSHGVGKQNDSKFPAQEHSKRVNNPTKGKSVIRNNLQVLRETAEQPNISLVEAGLVPTAKTGEGPGTTVSSALIVQ